MSSSLRLLPLLFVLPLALAADDPPLPAQMTLVDGGVREDEKGVVFWLEIESDLPESTSIELEAWLGTAKLSGALSRAYVAATGKCVVTVGPFDKALLPAEYAVKAIVPSVQGRQDRGLTEYFRPWGGRSLLETRGIRYGTAEQEQAGRKKEDEILLDWLHRAEALQEEVIQAGDAFRSKTIWHNPNDGTGKFDPKQFLSWCEAALEKYWKLSTEREQYYAAYEATYRHMTWMSSLVEILLSLRLIEIDYMIQPICKRNKLEMPRKAELVEAFMKPPRDACIEKNRGMFKEVYRAIGAWKGDRRFDQLPLPPDKCPSGYGLAHAPQPLKVPLGGNPYLAPPPTAPTCGAFGDWFGAGPISSDTLSAYCLFLSQGSTATRWGGTEEAPDLHEFHPHAGVYAFDFSSENAVKNFLERLKGLKKESKKDILYLRREFLVVVIDKLDEKGTDAVATLKAHYEQVLGTSAE